MAKYFLSLKEEREMGSSKQRREAEHERLSWRKSQYTTVPGKKIPPTRGNSSDPNMTFSLPSVFCITHKQCDHVNFNDTAVPLSCCLLSVSHYSAVRMCSNTLEQQSSGDSVTKTSWVPLWPLWFITIRHVHTPTRVIRCLTLNRRSQTQHFLYLITDIAMGCDR